MGSSSFVVVANRLPVDEVAPGSWRRSPGGLVTALHPVLVAQAGTWVGWTGSAADPDQEPIQPFELEGMRLRPVALSGDEVERYYEGFSNSSLWPLYHDAIETPIYKRSWWESYRRGNKRFAPGSAGDAAPGAPDWGQDYPLQPVAALLRALTPRRRQRVLLPTPLPPPAAVLPLTPPAPSP